MFVLNNIHDKNYRTLYPDIKGVIFDISEKQLSNAKNSAWSDIAEGDIVCVIKSTRRVSTFFRVDAKQGLGDDSSDYVLTGEVIAKLQRDEGMETLFSRFGVKHKYLPNNKFSIGLIVADIGQSLNAVSVKTTGGLLTLAELSAGEA